MRFLDRSEEMRRLAAAADRGGLTVLWGRRRIGKTRLLLEWCRDRDGLYTVADQSAPPIQRAYLAQAIARRFPGFDQVRYPDWRSLFDRLADEQHRAGQPGPVVIDEFPYLVSNSPELPSVLQGWLDRDSPAPFAMAVAGSSQRMMQGLVIGPAEPLYGRASAMIELRPLRAGYLAEAFGRPPARELVDAYAAWGGIPRYWELAADVAGSVDDAVEDLVLDPLGALHHEPERLLLEEVPPATPVRPLLDAIGLGAHRVSEIGGRLGQPASSLTRPLQRLQELGLVRREVPFGTSPKSSKRTLYRIADPFVRMWFRVVAPNRAILADAPREVRRSLWAAAKPSLVAEAWEELCREWVTVGGAGRVAAGGPWLPAGRYWRGNDPEWDVVSRSIDERRLLLGECRWHEGPIRADRVRRDVKDLLAKGVPMRADEVMRVLFIPRRPKGLQSRVDGVDVIAADEVLRGLR